MDRKHRFFSKLTAGISILLVAGCSTFGGGTTNNYIVFFADGSTTLTPEARAIVDQAAAAIRSRNPGMVAISTGVPGNNLQLAEPRFQAIQKALMDDGVPLAIIARATLSDPKENITPVANQRAEILLFVK